VLIEQSAYANRWRRVAPAAKGVFALAGFVAAFAAATPRAAVAVAALICLVTLAGARVAAFRYLRVAAPALFFLAISCLSLAFSVNAVGFIGASQFSGFLAARFGIARVVSVAVTCYAVLAVALFAVVAAGVDNLAVLIAMLFVAFAWLGLVIPSTMVLSLEDHGPIAGMASALGGTLQMVTGAVMIAVASSFFNGTSLPMVATIAACAVAAFILTRLTLGRRDPVTQLAE